LSIKVPPNNDVAFENNGNKKAQLLIYSKPPCYTHSAAKVRFATIGIWQMKK